MWHKNNSVLSLPIKVVLSKKMLFFSFSYEDYCISNFTSSLKVNHSVLSILFYINTAWWLMIYHENVTGDKNNIGFFVMKNPKSRRDYDYY